MEGSMNSRISTDATMWNNSGPTVPAIIPFVFFLVIIVTIILYLYKVLKKYYDKQHKSDTYVFVDRESDDTARLKKLVDEEDIANSPKLNSLRITNDNRGSAGDNNSNGEVKIDVGLKEGDLMQVDAASPPTAPEASDSVDQLLNDSDNPVSGTETLPLNKKKSSMPTESNV